MEEDKKEIIEVEKVSNTENTKKEATQEKVTETPKKEKKGFCIASMILGIVALVFFCIWYISIPCGILAIIFGILGVKTINKGMAIAGLITGSIGLVISSLILITLFMFGFAIGISETLDDVGNGHYRNYYNKYYKYDKYDIYD